MYISDTQPLWKSQDPQAENPVMFLGRLTGITKYKPKLTTLWSQGNHIHSKNPSAFKKQTNKHLQASPDIIF